MSEACTALVVERQGQRLGTAPPNSDPEIEVVGLLTTLNAEFDRVAMHAVAANC